jgi:hypothetical protein
MGLMKSSKRVTTRKAGAPWKGQRTDPSTEKKIDAARAMAEQIAAKLGQKSIEKEKDATQLTAEAIMRGTEAQPLALTVSKSDGLKHYKKMKNLPTFTLIFTQYLLTKKGIF